MAQKSTASLEHLDEPLSKRENEILAYLGEGLTDREIANCLHLAIRTIKWYNSQLYRKLGVSNRREATEQAHALGLLIQRNKDTVESPPCHNLPAPTTPFIGRKQELKEVTQFILQPDVRLVTILGAGGMGKTWLALEVARRLLYQFADGVFLVSLAPLRSSTNLVSTIAEAIDFKFHGSIDSKQQLLDYLHNRSMLLVLDNFEHLLDCAPLVMEIAEAAPRVEVLVTSRERLNLSGETVFILSGLPFPDQKTAEDALQYDAVQLFIQSAKRIRSDYSLQAEELEQVVHICQLTEGMPLALVLATAWIDVLSLAEIAEEIQQDVDFLYAEQRDVPRRQWSIRAVFAPTWDRLTNDERAVFMKFAVFQGGCTREAAQHVTGGTLGHFHTFVNKALLTRTPQGRYEIHELLRQIAEAHLIESGTADTVRQIHGEYYLRAVSQYEADIRGRRQLAALHEIETDFENIRAAWYWATANEGATDLHAAMRTLEIFGECGKRINDISELFRKIVAQTPPASYRLRCRALARACHLSHSYHQDMAELEDCLPAARMQNEPLELAYLLRVLAAAYGTVEQQMSQTIHLLEEAVTLYRAQNDHYGMAIALRELGYWLTAAGYDEESHATVRQSYEISRQIGARNVQAAMAAYLGTIAADRFGQFVEARRLFTEAIVIMREMDTTLHLVASPLPDLALWVHLLADGDLEAARECARQSLRIALDTRDSSTESISTLILGVAAGLERDYLVARELLETGRVLAAGEPYKTLIAGCGLALVHYGLGEMDIAKQYIHSVLSFFLRGFRFFCLTIAACIHASEGHLVQATELMAFVSEHPHSAKGWMKQWPEIAEIRSMLETELGPETYHTAWERGKTLDFETVVTELLASYDAAHP